jgi:hypothetical protein
MTLLHVKMERFSMRTQESFLALIFFEDNPLALVLFDGTTLTKEDSTTNPDGGVKPWKLVLGAHLMFFNSW